VLRRLAPLRAGVRVRGGPCEAEAPDGHAPRRRPARQEHRRRRHQLERIKELVAAGEEEGAEIYQPPCRLPEKGWWFPPTVFTNVAQSYRIAQEEIFGPVLSVLTFRTPDEAVEKANNTPYGLSAGVWTEKGSRILSMAQRLRAGVIWANTYNRFDPTSPFGGYKESGFGREGGLHGLEPYLRFDE
jgi:aldehyde dehydrogenase (NAD+)